MTLFLRLARLLFAEETVSAVFLPAVADFQHELHDASDSRATRCVIRCQWYWALAVLFLVTPLSQMSGGGSLFLLLYVPLFVGAWWCVQEFLVAAILAGVLLACAMRAWNDRHPASVAAPCALSPPPAFVQINFSSTPVPGDVAGLMFAAGTILIVVVGLPGFWLFFVAAALGSGLVAWQRARCLSRP